MALLLQGLDFPMPLRELAKKVGCCLGGHLFEGLLDALCEWLVRSLVALVAALLSGLLGVACRHGTATPLRHLLPAAESAAVRAAAHPPPGRRPLAHPGAEAHEQPLAMRP